MAWAKGASVATIAEYEDRRVSFGRVFERAFATLRHNPTVVLALAFVFGVIPAVAIQYLISQVPDGALLMTVGSIVLPGTFALAMLRWFVSFVTGTIVQGGMTRPVVAESEGRRAGLSECFAAAGRMLVSLIGLGLILGISVIIGTTILIVPGIIIFPAVVGRSVRGGRGTGRGLPRAEP